MTVLMLIGFITAVMLKWFMAEMMLTAVMLNGFMADTAYCFRTNLELELLLRGGSLENPLSPATSKRLCLCKFSCNIHLKSVARGCE